jgi:hypothetical protein
VSVGLLGFITFDYDDKIKQMMDRWKSIAMEIKLVMVSMARIIVLNHNLLFFDAVL